MFEKQPLIIKKAMQISQERMKILIPEIERMARGFESTLKENKLRTSGWREVRQNVLPIAARPYVHGEGFINGIGWLAL